MSDVVPQLFPYGDRAVLVELADTETVVAWVDALERDRPDGVSDVVPAARTVLVVVDEHAEVAAVRAALERVKPAPFADDTHEGEPVTVPVRYDGPDLSDVARLTGLSEREVVEAHIGSTWRVAFGGFAPGFAYLVGGDPRLNVPRRESSRTEVPAGAVGLAGEFSGVYPRASPGGWQLIGTTDTAMWDLGRDPPALLVRGARVRFAVDGEGAS